MTVPPVLTCSIAPAAEDAASTDLLVLGPSIGTTTSLWESTLPFLRAALPRTRILRFDLPGHGSSPRAGGAQTLSDLADAVVRLVDQVGGGRFHYAGVSLGGAIGIELAARHPERLLSLALIATDARIGTVESWTDRALQVRTQGTSSLVEGSSQRWFAADSVAREPDGTSRALRELETVDDESYALAAEALAVFDRRGDLSEIAHHRIRTVAVSGAADAVTTPDDLARLADALGAPHVSVDDAAHLVPIEQPESTAAAIAALVTGASTGSAPAPGSDSDRARFDRGMRVRREVLGDAHVDAATARITPETAAFQEFITRYAWGEVWDRPNLDRRARSVATLASLVTGGHHAEITMHVRAALRNGLTRDQITEVMLHTALYAGLPAANAALALARDVFASLDDER
ncbi:3-oxoadipate enol-lactonase [Cnuibacter physcomitrellae]|uniref:Uncharacterized protein n=1 Tax=Cnuibacter physcomitrellae TaxID=1619308 RepID=A0A1X9LGI1_9MICO|nr:alpha/beta fold hydrolase [Cnuibacter physcomitrellae]ARJ04316.1 hypothetical protein B5808_03025 [Cnuibacter physcomitrellae]GGI40752.1 3-oxoadipate enol-lactonase [Cnuibacter physcomitrellae]